MISPSRDIAPVLVHRLIRQEDLPIGLKTIATYDLLQNQKGSLCPQRSQKPVKKDPSPLRTSVCTDMSTSVDGFALRVLMSSTKFASKLPKYCSNVQAQSLQVAISVSRSLQSKTAGLGNILYQAFSSVALPAEACICLMASAAIVAAWLAFSAASTIRIASSAPSIAAGWLLDCPRRSS